MMGRLSSGQRPGAILPLSEEKGRDILYISVSHPNIHQTKYTADKYFQLNKNILKK
jgi:hypothetical protein